MNSYLIRKTIKELEPVLEPFGFIKVNRKALANKRFLHNYSYWEYDKFILRMQDEDHTEFIVSRERMKRIKGFLAQKT